MFTSFFVTATIDDITTKLKFDVTKVNQDRSNIRNKIARKIFNNFFKLRTI